MALHEERGVAAVLKARTEENRRAESRRLEDGVQAGRVKAAADERDVGERVEIAEHSDAIDHDDVRVARRVVETIRAQRASLGPREQFGDVLFRRLVWRDDESHVDARAAQRFERGEQHRFVGWPRRTGDDRRRCRGGARAGATSRSTRLGRAHTWS